MRTTFTFSLPQDQDADQIEIHEAINKDSNYSLFDTISYEYGNTTVNVDVSTTRWYKLRFINTQNQTQEQFSEPVYGGNVVLGAPFLAVSTTTDGAHYATAQDVYDFANLTTQDASQNQVSSALRRARALIDYRTAEMDFDRFDVFDDGVAKRKYNATLRILKEAELHIALGSLYQSLSDDLIMQARRDQEQLGQNVSIGGTSVSGSPLQEQSDSIAFLAALSDNYYSRGEQLLASLDAATIRLRPIGDKTMYPRFNLPFNGIDSYRPVR